MLECFLDTKAVDSIPLMPVQEATYQTWLEQQDATLVRWLSNTGFVAKAGNLCLIPGADGVVASVVVGILTTTDAWACGDLSKRLPAGNYHLATDWEAAAVERTTIGWGLGAYRFTRYKDSGASVAKLVVDPACNAALIRNQVEATYLVRDLINTPAEDMMPEHLAEIIDRVGHEFGATVRQIVGDELLSQNYPTIHRVGRASMHAPRLIDLRWGDVNHPKVTLVGKGVCFDSGGLDLKSAAGMRLMKKDMGGAAHALGLALMVMDAGLPVCLRLLVPAVENAVSGDAMRPGDIITSRQGLTIEVDNTDAEGRLILCDALTEGGAEQPELLIDFATLTGAARVALGTDLPALFSNSDELADGLLAGAERVGDPMWRMPLHAVYREMLDSSIADIANSANAPFAGAITAALFLQEFVTAGVNWAHFDMMAWNRSSKPGRPEGGEAMGIRGVFDYLRQRFAP
ncbi:MAG: leucyl aminopeptidase family protein [bacterium]|nr:leucyl aminopeptidase family protein [bacterium]